VLYERRHTRRLAEFGGLWAKMPVFGALFLIIVLGSAGLPGLSGFVGEFLTIFGTFIAYDGFPDGYPGYLPHPKLLAALAATGVILGAVYLLYMFQKVMFGPITKPENEKLKDVNGRELVVLLPLVALIFAMGIYPRPFLKSMEPSVNLFLKDYKAKLGQADGEARLASHVGAGERPTEVASHDRILDDAPDHPAGGRVFVPRVVERIAAAPGGSR
jgi:NADH-quinone oxidoreductase subunit M